MHQYDIAEKGLFTYFGVPSTLRKNLYNAGSESPYTHNELSEPALYKFFPTLQNREMKKTIF